MAGEVLQISAHRWIDIFAGPAADFTHDAASAFVETRDFNTFSVSRAVSRSVIGGEGSKSEAHVDAAQFSRIHRSAVWGALDSFGGTTLLEGTNALESEADGESVLEYRFEVIVPTAYMVTGLAEVSGHVAGQTIAEAIIDLVNLDTSETVLRFETNNTAPSGHVVNFTGGTATGTLAAGEYLLVYEVSILHKNGLGTPANAAADLQALFTLDVPDPGIVVNGEFEAGGLGWTITGPGTAEVIAFPLDAENHVFNLTAGSPVTISQAIDTPSAPFLLEFDYLFTTTTGSLSVLLDGVPHTVLAAPSTSGSDLVHASFLVDDASLLGQDDVTLEFVLDGTMGSNLVLDNVGIGDPFPLDALVDQNGTLIIQGDDGDNVISVTGIGTGTGNYILEASQGTQTVSGVTGGILLNLGDGNDQLTLNNVYVAGAIDIQTGTGDDTVVLGDNDVVSSAGDLRIDLGAGNDTLDGKRLYIGGNQIINGGDGDDELIFDGFLSPRFTLGTSAAGFAFWSGGSGNDTVSVVYGFIVGAWGIYLGDGMDSLDVFGSAVSGDVVFSGDAGDDTLTIDTNFFDATHVISGLGGNDTVLLANGLGTELTSIVTGDGNDRVTVRNQTTNHLSLDTGAGNDEVDVRSSAFDRFFALLGGDNDQLTVHGNLSQFETDLDGGLGDADRLRDLGNSFFGSYQRRRFELFG